MGFSFEVSEVIEIITRKLVRSVKELETLIPAKT